MDVELTNEELKNSFLFGRMHDLGPDMINGRSSDDLKNSVMGLFPGVAGEWNDANPFFEGHALLAEAIDAFNRQDYAHFGDLIVQVDPLLQKEFEKNPYIETATLIASIAAIHDDDESANKILYWALRENIHGTSISENFKTLWVLTAWATGFEAWMQKTFGLGFDGPSAYEGKDANGNATNINQSSSPQGGGCYVATAVYGSYDCPEVWTLRRYRDYDLAKTWYGRAFIHTYYAISPTIVKYFGDTQIFKDICKPRLDHLVKRLQNDGYQSTPYNDKIW